MNSISDLINRVNSIADSVEAATKKPALRDMRMDELVERYNDLREMNEKKSAKVAGVSKATLIVMINREEAEYKQNVYDAFAHGDVPPGV